MYRKVFLLFVTLIPILCYFVLGSGQKAHDEKPTLAERLGYDASARLLIVHADDLGLCNSVNRASFEALSNGGVSSASIMVPCPWTPQVAAAARSNPDWDLGIHLTLNAEWEVFKWGPVSSLDKVRSLLDPRGYFPETVQEVVQKVDADEAETEIRSQIERARVMGIEPTHLDSHMGTLFQSPEVLKRTLQVAHEYKLPFLLPKALLFMAPAARDLLTEEDILIDDLAMLSPATKPEDWPRAYTRIISGLKPGVTQLIVHLGFDDPELQAVTVNHPDFGSAWRQRDFDYVLSAEFRQLIQEEGVQMVTWREIGRLLRE